METKELRNYYIDKTILDTLPSDQLECLKEMESIAAQGLPAWLSIDGISEEAFLYRTDALTLLGYYDRRNSYGVEKRCEKCDILLEFSKDCTHCFYCEKLGNRLWKTNCHYCHINLQTDHNYKTFGECCEQCSAILTALVRDLSPVEDEMMEEIIRKHYIKLLNERKYVQ